MSRRELIPSTDWASLRDLFLIDWPKHILPYYLLQNYINWLAKDPKYVQENVEIYCLDGDWKDGTFYLLDDLYLFFHTLDADNMRLESLLFLSLDKSKTYRCRSVHDCHLSILNKVVQRLGMQKTYEASGLMVRMPCELAGSLPDLPPPENVFLAPLRPEHVEVITLVYPYRDQSTPRVLERIIRLNASVGAFEKESGKLIGFSIQFQTGEISFLQVFDKNWLRAGLGGVILAAMSRKVASMGSDLFGIVALKNVPINKFSAKYREMGINVDFINTTHYVVFGPEKSKL